MLFILMKTSQKSLELFSLTFWDSKWMITLFFLLGGNLCIQ